MYMYLYIYIVYMYIFIYWSELHELIKAVAKIFLYNYIYIDTISIYMYIPSLISNIIERHAYTSLLFKGLIFIYCLSVIVFLILFFLPTDSSAVNSSSKHKLIFCI